MAVITQYYDIDLRANGEYPVVKMSQFDTGSRTIVFTVYDGHDLAHIDGMVARVDGTRCDGVEFSQSCTVSTGSKVSFTISQEITKVSGKHTAELVIFDADGNPIGTQNFVIEVEAAVMRRNAAASADDRTLYDQFTDSVSKTVDSKITQMDSSVSKTVNDKMASVDSKMAVVDSKMASVDSKMSGVDTQISAKVNSELDNRIKTDPLLGAWSNYSVEGTVNFGGNSTKQIIPLKIKSQSDGASAVYGSNTSNSIYIYKPGVYQLMVEGWYNSNVEINSRNTVVDLVSDSSAVKREWSINCAKGSGSVGGESPLFSGSITFAVPNNELPYLLNVYTVGTSAVTLDKGSLTQIVITRISSTWTPVVSSGVNTLTVGTTTTGEPGTQASVTNSGTAKDVVLDFTIPKGDKGEKGDPCVATSDKAGIVKPGNGLVISNDGTLTVQTFGDLTGKQANRVAVNSCTNDSVGIAFNSSFNKNIGTEWLGQVDVLCLNHATSSILGGVKIGAGISVSSDGTIDVQALLDRISALETKVAALEAK